MAGSEIGDQAFMSGGVVTSVETTGRLLVLMEPLQRRGGRGPTMQKAADDAFSSTIGVSLAHSSDFQSEQQAMTMMDSVGDSQGLFLDELGIAVIESHEEYARPLAVSAADPDHMIGHVEPERVVWAFNDFLSGYQTGVNDLAEALLARPGATTAPDEVGASGLVQGTFVDDATYSWGLRAVGVPATRLTGRGARVAVLDTGVDRTHPDLASAIDTVESFVANETGDDGHGHGTHCCGTIASQLTPAAVGRYGVAPDARLFAGKVLANNGRGSDGGILAGIQWAMQNNCHIVSMSLGADVPAGTPYSLVFEDAARKALAGGTIIVAAAGNASRRPQRVAPVGHPANCPSILAVGAVEQNMAIAPFSSAGRTGEAAVNISAPGVDVLSARLGGGHVRMSGTSMATPHVAGVAAVLHEQFQVGGPELALRLLLSAQGLAVPAVDAGAGICQVAP